LLRPHVLGRRETTREKSHGGAVRLRRVAHAAGTGVEDPALATRPSELPAAPA
jgi:hypothetical protein